ncbi:hypothetical protein SEVIR_6G140600v4 [Setaria viridis]|uniref:Uncharacterized protein n=1 Tax=Setaria viridis TaxID=4556 RepID=A0A4U6U9H2_SETVI|nr:hypothetical protein SEVIR_6G140600v2 [Setaria viridis]TKW10110.1 hypothetical protein SEVIR_6G140633v2 [Setaria viridis]
MIAAPHPFLYKPPASLLPLPLNHVQLQTQLVSCHPSQSQQSGGSCQHKSPSACSSRSMATTSINLAFASTQKGRRCAFSHRFSASFTCGWPRTVPPPRVRATAPGPLPHACGRRRPPRVCNRVAPLPCSVPPLLLHHQLHHLGLVARVTDWWIITTNKFLIICNYY